MAKTLLKKISRIDTGRSFRHRIEDNPNGNCWVIQMKDISKDRLSIIDSPHSILIDEVNPNQLLKRGDILFMAKGNNNFAVLYDSDQPAVAVSLFFIVRPDPQKVHPEYLTWFLNSSIAQSYFQKRRLGASVGNIRKDALESLEIQLPNLEEQKQVAKLNKLMQKERILTHKYLEKKELLLNQAMLNLSKQ